MSGSTPSLESAQFPILRAAAPSATRFDAALADIAEGVKAASIRNSVLNEAKFVLANAASDGWNKQVNAPFFHAGEWKNQTQDVQDLGDSILIMSLHDVISASKKVQKSTAKGPAVDAMRAYCAEVLPLAQAVAALKDKVVKGRASRIEPAQPENPDKLVQTCPVCFRPIAVLRDTMAHHGYKRPNSGWQTASCAGVRFKPLEVSSEGLVWLIGVLRDRLGTLEQSYSRRDRMASLTVRKSGRKSEMETITPESPRWADQFNAFVVNLESEIRSLQRELPALDAKLAKWKPAVIDFDHRAAYRELQAKLQVAEKATGIYLADEAVDAENAVVKEDADDYWPKMLCAAKDAALMRADEAGIDLCAYGIRL